MTDPREDLWLRFLASQPLTTDEKRELLRAIEFDSGFRKTVLDDAELHGLLRAFGSSDRDAEGFLKGVSDFLSAENDEAQFLSQAQVRQLARVVDERDIPVMCYGLRTDFRGELFPGSAALLAWADTLAELKTICCCGRKATMVVRVSPEGVVERAGQQIEIGGNERYVSLCRKHFSESMKTGVCTEWRQEGR